MSTTTRAWSESISRRRFLASAAAASAGLALGCGRATDPEGASSDGFDHVLVVTMENRSFDHMLGWVPDADGRQDGLCFTDRDGNRQCTYALAPDFQGCAHPDPDHSYGGGRIQLNNGACDGFLRSGVSDRYSVGYYRRADLDFFANAIGDWTTADRYFSSLLGPTLPNRLYLHTGQTDRISNSPAPSTLPTIWDRLAQAGRTARYYYSDISAMWLWGDKYASISRTIDAFHADAAAGTLPNLAFIEPKFAAEPPGTSTDDHPFADVRAGQHFMHQIYTAVTTSPNWRRTVLVFNYDEWGGFFDHVPPPIGAVSPTDIAGGNVDGRLGFRTPLLVVSPFARAGHVAHDVYDHTSILKMVEVRWNLAPLGARDAAANNLADVLDLTQAPRTAPQYPTPPIAVSAPCPSGAARSRGVATAIGRRAPWRELARLAAANGWSRAHATGDRGRR